MDDDVAISVRNVGKMYYLYDRPQDRLKQAFLWGRKKLYREFWALRDVSFEVKRGEALGIPSTSPSTSLRAGLRTSIGRDRARQDHVLERFIKEMKDDFYRSRLS